MDDKIMGALRLLAAMVLVCGAGTLQAADTELEKLKAAANESRATLAVRTELLGVNGYAYERTEFRIDTGRRAYALQYKSFLGPHAELNPKSLNDWCSGYGMLEPHPYWYHGGFLSAAVVGAASVCTDGIQGQVRPLATAGVRVGYDLVFAGGAGLVVIRTLAMAGRDELFVSVSGQLKSGENATLTSTFRGYPLGMKGPFDRWVHGDGQDIQNSGATRTTTPLKLGGAPWLLLADHKLDPEGQQAGLLGLIYDRKAVSSANMTTDNYSITVSFEGPATAEQRFIVYTLGPLTWEAACKKLADVKDAAELLDQAFQNLHPALESEPQ